MSATRVAKRGFYAKSPAAVERLETVGRSFLTGYGYAVGCPTIEAATAELETVPTQFRGFAYEGAAMGYAMLEGLAIAGRNRLSTFLSGPGAPHVYMAYVGIGWAMARLPRWRWRSLPMPDPLLRWLALDGYGFHQAYFHTRRYVIGQYRDPAFDWPFGSAGGYADRAVDQGIGRALWFVEGTDVTRVADRISTFPRHRQQDLWSGAGLAVTYAGGIDEPELRRFLDLAGDHRPYVALAAAFAAEARLRAGLADSHTALATEVLCGLPPRAAAELTVQARTDLPTDGPDPAYGRWRDQVAHRLASLRR